MHYNTLHYIALNFFSAFSFFRVLISPSSEVQKLQTLQLARETPSPEKCISNSPDAFQHSARSVPGNFSLFHALTFPGEEGLFRDGVGEKND